MSTCASHDLKWFRIIEYKYYTGTDVLQVLIENAIRKKKHFEFLKDCWDINGNFTWNKNQSVHQIHLTIK